MKLACWNVNSIRVRLPRLLAWLEAQGPDVLCLQETKVVDAQFPFAELQGLGYHALTVGQKTYNGVAILSRTPATDPCSSVGLADDTQARFLAATIAGVRVISAYVPNGSEPDSEKYVYKLAWLEALARRVREELAHHPRLALCGDMNIAPTDDDVHDPEAWREQILCTTRERAALAAVTDHLLIDVVRKHQPGPGLYSWWDYRQLGFFKNRGLRIDHIFASAALADASQSALIDREARKGQQPSDHAPVIATFASEAR